MRTSFLSSALLLMISVSFGQINFYCTDSNLSYQTPQNYKTGSMDGYLTYQELLNELDLMKEKYPHLISTRAPIGNFLTEGTPDNSVTPSIGGNPLEWVRISDNPEQDEDEPEILYDSLIHGGEWGSLMQLVYYMWYLLENYENDATIKEIIDNAELYFVPVVNPDGLLYSQVFYNEFPEGGNFGRKNRKNAFTPFEGVDLNRNFNHFINGDPNNQTWGGEGSNTFDPLRYDYAGTEPFSETETKAIKWFTENHEFLLHLTYHNSFGASGGSIYYPYFFNASPPPEENTFKNLLTELTSINNYKVTTISRPLPGLYVDFMYGTVGTHQRAFSILMEVPSGTTGLLRTTPERVIEISKETLSKNITAAKLILNYASVTDKHPLHTGGHYTPEISFEIERVGLSGSGNFIVSFEPVSNNILGAGRAVTATNLDLHQSYEGSIQVNLDPSIVEGEEIIFDIVINNGRYNKRKRVIKKFGEATTVFQNSGEHLYEDFEVTGGDLWEISEDDYVSGPLSIKASSTTSETSFLTSKRTIDLTNATSASVSYFTKWDLKALEFVTFEVSLDNENWEPMCGILTRISDREEHLGEPGYNRHQYSWALEEIDLEDYLGEVIYYRFKYVPLIIRPEADFWLDDIRVNVVTRDQGQTANTRLDVYPNPTNDILYIDTDYKNYTIQLFDVLGRQMEETRNSNGSQYLDFSGFSSGMYFLKVNANNKTETLKILKQ